jgi:signal transduction histidine kinase
MSFAMHNATLELRPANIVSNDELERLCANMSQGLHALAQPLTIVRSAVAALAAPGIATQKQRRYLELCTQHVERTCDLFESMQELVSASHIDPDCEPIDLREALGSVLEDRKASLRASGIELLIELPKMLPLVLGDIKRTHQALSAALDCAVSISSPGDYIELRVSIHNEFVELNLQNSGIRDRAIQATHRLKLTLAEVNIRSQHGKYECVEYPFEVFIALPLQEGLP